MEAKYVATSSGVSSGEHGSKEGGSFGSGLGCGATTVARSLVAAATTCAHAALPLSAESLSA